MTTGGRHFHYILCSEQVSDAELVIIARGLVDMEGDTFMSPCHYVLITLSFKYLFMSWLFNSKIMVNMQGRLVYAVMGLIICWNVYL